MNATRRVRKLARRLFRDCSGAIGVDEDRARRAVMAIIASRRRDGFALLTEFRRLVRLDVARHRAVVESAVPVPIALRTDIEAYLDRTYGPGLEISFKQVAALIGGMRITVGSDIRDDSVRARLAALEDRIASSPAPDSRAG